MLLLKQCNNRILGNLSDQCMIGVLRVTWYLHFLLLLGNTAMFVCKLPIRLLLEVGYRDDRIVFFYYPIQSCF